MGRQSRSRFATTKRSRFWWLAARANRWNYGGRVLLAKIVMSGQNVGKMVVTTED